jgi:hypothetical protein
MSKELIIGFGAGLLIGGVASYFVTRKLTTQALEGHYEKVYSEERERLRDHYERRYKEGEYKTPEKAHDHVEKLKEDGDFGYNTVSSVVEKDEVVEEPQENASKKDHRPYHIFDPNNKEELAGEAHDTNDVTTWPRDPAQPYVISEAEYMDDNGHYDKLTVTWFEYDNVLIDERDTIVPDIDGVLGEKNLLHFGKGTTSEDIVYIRDDRNSIDFEVIRDEQSYSAVVFGHDPDAESGPPKVKKMRSHD